MKSDEQPIWRERALSLAEQRLWDAVMRAHRQSVFRENGSSCAVVQAFAGSGDYTKAIAAALMTLGGVHAPFLPTIGLLTQEDPAGAVREALAAGCRVPGWGNSFVRGKKDPLWEPVDEVLRVAFPWMWQRLEAVTAVLHGEGVRIYPNPSAYTASTVLVLEMPAALAAWVFVSGRLDGWTELLLNRGGAEARREGAQ